MSVDLSELKDLIDTFDGLGDHIKEESKKRIERRTPVDTGLAKNSWFIEEDGIYSSDEGGKIMALEYGHSNQAPLGMVRITAAEVPEIVDRYIERNT